MSQYTNHTRSLKVTITKMIGGNEAVGYPKTYPLPIDVNNKYFTVNNINYTIPDDYTLARMSELDYEYLVDAFKTYISKHENISFGVDFTNTNVGYDPEMCSGTVPILSVESEWDLYNCIIGEPTTTTVEPINCDYSGVLTAGYVSLDKDYYGYLDGYTGSLTPSVSIGGNDITGIVYNVQNETIMVGNSITGLPNPLVIGLYIDDNYYQLNNGESGVVANPFVTGQTYNICLIIGEPSSPIIMTFNIASSGETLTLPLVTSNNSQFNFDIDWGDGSTGMTTTSHVYSTSGIKTVTIQGQMEGWSFNNGGDKDKLLSVSGGDGHVFKYLYGAFYGCSNLTSFNCPNWDISNVTDMSHMFRNCLSLTTLNVSNFNTSGVTDMNAMFMYCSNLTTLDVSNWDTSNVTNMNNMFIYCSNLTTIDMSNWDTSNVTNMSAMFSTCSSLTTLDVSGFNTSNVTNMNNMFSTCSSLTTLDVSNFNTSGVTAMSLMFRFCSSLTTLDVSNWDTSNVTYMNNMFENCLSLTTLDVSGFNTSSITQISVIFNNCQSLTTLDVSNWDTSNVTYMSDMFSDCSSLTTLDVSNWDTSNVIHMNRMFTNCTSLTSNMPSNVFWENLGVGSTSVISYINCFTNATNISNYSSIPSSWGGGGA